MANRLFDENACGKDVYSKGACGAVIWLHCNFFNQYPIISGLDCFFFIFSSSEKHHDIKRIHFVALFN